MLFAYKDINNKACICDVERHGDLLIVTELHENKGMSVTNSIELIVSDYVNENNMR